MKVQYQLQIFAFFETNLCKIEKINIDYVYPLRKAGLLQFIKIGQYKVIHKSLIQFLEKYEGYDLTDPFNIKKLNDN